MSSSLDDSILSKSLALLEKTRRRVEQIDTATFPTVSSRLPRELLLKVLENLALETSWKAMDAESLYHTLISFQKCVAIVEASSSELISSPLVSYCDHFWKLLFPSGDFQIFYSVYPDHNFSIGSFSNNLRVLLRSILTPADIDKIIGNQQIYYLAISSLEIENLPSYANIGHEFGHALYDVKKAHVIKITNEECNIVFSSIKTDLSNTDKTLEKQRVTQAAAIISKIVIELFCDLIGFMIAGPAFLLSLYEMGWGMQQNSWTAVLNPSVPDIKAYPSFAFRLSCIKSLLSTQSFHQDLIKKLSSLDSEKIELKKIADFLQNIPDDYSIDHPAIRPIDSLDAKAILQAFVNNFAKLKTSLKIVFNRCYAEAIADLKTQPEFAAVSGDDVFDLIQRLDSDILPNIIPQPGSLLGSPAKFAAILNACALFRIHILSTRVPSIGYKEIYQQVHKVERLTAKAFEVSYIQHEYNKWVKNRP